MQGTSSLLAPDAVSAGIFIIIACEWTCFETGRFAG